MAKYLVVMESGRKCKSVQKYLGSDYKVLPTVGHLIDLPEKKIGVDIKKQFTPTWTIMPGKKEILSKLLTAAKGVQLVYLMTDPDREGEAISWHLANKFPKSVKFKRATTSSITKKEVLEAIKNASSIDSDLVEAYETRRILDRLAGYKCSYPVKQATGGKSVGRVQSACLRTLAEREKEIQKFVPVIYYPVEAELLTKKKEKVLAMISKPDPLKIASQKEADNIIKVLKKGPIKVSKFAKTPKKESPKPPFTTSDMQQAASTYLGFSPDRTMKIAQSLYEAGKITYHRTDSRSIHKDKISDTRKYVQANLTAKYMSPSVRVFKNKSKNAQEAHEAIRPTDIAVKSVPGSSEEKKLYEIIWKRIVASQMADRDYLQCSAEFECDKYKLKSSGSKTTFDGWRNVWDYALPKGSLLPDMKVGDEVDGIDFKSERKETKPPQRYSEASLVKRMEELGIGRPATYAAIIATLKTRTYIALKKKAIHTTDLGVRVSDFLVDVGFCFVDLNFTANMENDLDAISNGKESKLKVLDEFWKRVKKDLETAKVKRVEFNTTKHDCPKCKKVKLIKKFSQFGPFYGCANYNNKENKCDYTAQIGEDGSPVEKVKKKVEYSDDHVCPKCKGKMAIRKGKYGDFLGCSKFPKCKSMMTMEGEVIVSKKSKWKKKGKK